MHQRICIAIGRIRQDVGTLLSPVVIHQICSSVGHIWRVYPHSFGNHSRFHSSGTSRQHSPDQSPPSHKTRP